MEAYQNAASGARAEFRESHVSGQERRILLQTSTAINLLVNVTFPLQTSVTGSQQAAVALNQALASNSTSVLAGFQQVWGTTSVNGVQLTYVTMSSPSPGTPATSPPSGGSVGSLVGIAVAAVIGCTILAGALCVPPYCIFQLPPQPCKCSTLPCLFGMPMAWHKSWAWLLLLYNWRLSMDHAF